MEHWHVIHKIYILKKEIISSHYELLVTFFNVLTAPTRKCFAKEKQLTTKSISIFTQVNHGLTVQTGSIYGAAKIRISILKVEKSNQDQKVRTDLEFPEHSTASPTLFP